MLHIDTALFFPMFLYFYKNNKEIGRLFFYIILSSFSFYEFIDKKMYYFQYNDLNEYNYFGEKCRILVTQYFLIDIFYVSNKAFFFTSYVNINWIKLVLLFNIIFMFK